VNLTDFTHFNKKRGLILFFTVKIYCFLCI